ncbi:hypothetical protein MVEN_02333400 [Mycena venus]|uniref:Uncharacterized protein n=1 Tax=Mycena venus TaxID=2733690 RepID=A0A8H6X3H7_9AGAR|nr:hypothetical protein MVEN_02333400 [Mycena venus]
MNATQNPIDDGDVPSPPEELFVETTARTRPPSSRNCARSARAHPPSNAKSPALEPGPSEPLLYRPTHARALLTDPPTNGSNTRDTNPQSTENATDGTDAHSDMAVDKGHPADEILAAGVQAGAQERLEHRTRHQSD